MMSTMHLQLESSDMYWLEIGIAIIFFALGWLASNYHWNNKKRRPDYDPYS